MLAACWAHARRKFYEFHQATRSPIAAEALRRIAELYAIEKEIRGRSAMERQGTRDSRSRPLSRGDEALARGAAAPGSANAAGWPMPSAMRSRAGRRCAASSNDGRIELDNNPVERAIRPVALGRKNHLFAGSDGGADRWAIVASILATAKLNDIEPYAYLSDVLRRMSDGHPVSRIDELLPWNWTPKSTNP